MSETNNYRKLNQELEAILGRLQSSNLDIDQTIKEYEKGVMIVDQLEKYLKSARNKVTKITQRQSKPKK